MSLGGKECTRTVREAFFLLRWDKDFDLDRMLMERMRNLDLKDVKDVDGMLMKRM